MRAFVLSGGGNRGPLEVGALQVLLEHGIAPDMLVGSSAGAVNAAFLATSLTPQTALELEKIWVEAREEGVFQHNRLTMVWRFLTGRNSLYDNQKLRRLVEERLPERLTHFSDLKEVRLYIVATRLETGELRVFGDDPEELLLDAIMSSTALPPFFPPWRCGDELLVDGGMAADLPVKVAANRGAKDVYALHLVDAQPKGTQLRGVVDIAEKTITAVLARQQHLDLEASENLRDVTIHYVPLTGFYGIPLWDLSHTEAMVESGRRQMEEYLQASPKISEDERFSSFREALRRGLRTIRAGLSHLPVTHRFLGQGRDGISNSIKLGS
jgi:NTE family protein